MDKHIRITAMTRFLIVSDELDKLVANAIENIIADPPNQDSSGLEMTYVP